MRPTVLNLPAASGQLINTGGCLTWHSTRETSGAAAAAYRIWDGSSASGTKLLDVSLVASGSARDFIGQHVLPFKTGLYFELVSGALEGSVAVALEHDCARYLLTLLDAALQAGG